MEFNQLINRYLVRDPESRKRNLHIRTYGVIPLNEDCGLIEWIPNLIGLRHILNRIYKEKGNNNTDLRRRLPQLRDTIARKRELFEKGMSVLFIILGKCHLIYYCCLQKFYQDFLPYLASGFSVHFRIRKIGFLLD